MAWFLISLMLIVYTLVCVFLIFVILIQSGKGGGLSSLGSSSQGISETLGATGAEKTLNKVTTWCAILFMVLAIGLSLIGTHTVNRSSNRIFKQPAGEAQAPISAQPGETAPAPVNGKATTTAPKAQAPGATSAAKTVPPVSQAAPRTAPAPAPATQPKPAAPAPQAPATK